MKSLIARKEEEMLKRHKIEKNRFPKVQREEMKVRQSMFKQSLKINNPNMSVEVEREKLRKVTKVNFYQYSEIYPYLIIFKFDEQEQSRFKQNKLRQELKHKKQWDELKMKNEFAMTDLLDIQVQYY